MSWICLRSRVCSLCVTFTVYDRFMSLNKFPGTVRHIYHKLYQVNVTQLHITNPLFLIFIDPQTHDGAGGWIARREY